MSTTKPTTASKGQIPILVSSTFRSTTNSSTTPNDDISEATLVSSTNGEVPILVSTITTI